MPTDMPKESYIWNLTNPNKPEKTLLAPSPLCCMAFNHKNADIVVGGSYNGSLSFFDTRDGNSAGVIRPILTTVLEKSHHDPVYGVNWVQTGKTGNECVSLASDGRIIWWDRFNTAGTPKDSYQLTDKITGEDGEVKEKILGGTALEYLAEAGPLNYLVGSEQGLIVMANKRKQLDITRRFGYESGKHHGPVYSLWRNPSH
jgi:dynein intermediate chain 2